MTAHISREEAKALIDEADGGLLMLVMSEEVPTIGSVPEDERDLEYDLETYQFGQFWEDEEDNDG